ncbi:MAG: TolC family protein [Paraprevotella sp.]|nr:TolC family protein [Paraprevotella sp.]
MAILENENISTVSSYFDLLTSMSNLESARQNERNASELYKAACAKGEIGTISDSDLMQLRVGLLNANANVLTAENDYLEKMNALKNYLGLDENTEITPVVPDVKTIPSVSIEDIRRKAYENNPIYDNFKIRLIEAEANVVKEKRERFPDVNLNLSVGTTGSHPTLGGAYTHLGNRQIAQIGISVPILDWGKRKGNYIQAKADYDLTVSKTEREEREFNEKVRILAEDFLDQQKLAKIYREAESVALERYNIALNRFAVGDISVTDLNYAEQEKDNARRNYIYQLYLSGLYYYNLRYITLFDFEKGTNIVYDYEYKR